MKSFSVLGLLSTKRFLFALKILLALFFCSHFGFFLAGLFYILPLSETDITQTAIMDYRFNNKGIENHQQQSLFLKEIPADIVNGIVLIEDMDFFKHQGFDLEAIEFAVRINRELGYTAYGGSTLTQQLARTLFLNPQKNYLRKYLELLLALELDFLLSKERILELYLNYAEWGPGIYGLQAAAEYHFQKSVKDLDYDEKVILIALLANPLDFKPSDLAQGEALKARVRAVKKALSFLHSRKPQFNSKIRELD